MNHKKAYILGLGASGEAAARFLLKRGVEVFALETFPFSERAIKAADDIGISLLPEEEKVEYNEKEDLFILSPGIPLSHKTVEGALQKKCEVIGEIELGLRHLKGKAIGISGTNGKTTVTLLVAHVLRSAGVNAIAAGNLGAYGMPLTAAIDAANGSEEALFVIELSSFQLETATARRIDSALLLNITQDHLDRYGDMEAYAAAKARLGAIVKPGGRFFVQERCFKRYPHLFDKMEGELFGWKGGGDLQADECGVWYKGKLVYSWEQHPSKQLLPAYKAENELGAFALCSSFGIDSSQFLTAIQSFAPPHHRCEVVAAINNTVYYDDSKGTNVDATWHAVASLPGSIILIAGGVDKNSDYTPWRELFEQKVKAVLVIGSAAEKIGKQLQGAVQTVQCKSMEEAVEMAHSLAAPGDAVLLSPGCASFDMFNNYAERGKVFQNCVCALRARQMKPSHGKRDE